MGRGSANGTVKTGSGRSVSSSLLLLISLLHHPCCLYLPTMLWLFVGLGGLVGSLARYFLGTAVQGWVGAGFPAGTMVVNISASFLIGIIMQYSVESSALTPEVRILLTTGFCGGYSTFSSFSWESVRLLQDGEWGRAAFYVGGSLFVSLAATFLGIAAAHRFITLRRTG